jgi:mannose-6-phosphate isomerase-like protein (cupin superfamily)
VFPIRKVA